MKRPNEKDLEEEDKESTREKELSILTEGPLKLLKEAMDEEANILISCRDDQKILGSLHYYDKHMNMLLGNVTVIAKEREKKTSKGKLRKRKIGNRYLGNIFLRGDNIILVTRVYPKKSKNVGLEDNNDENPSKKRDYRGKKGED